MNGIPTRSYTRVALAIIIGAIIISATALSYSSYEVTLTKTVTTTGINTGVSDLYDVEFLQESNCPNGSWVAPWAVAIGGQTTSQPSNATVPQYSNEVHFTDESNYSVISLLLPDGTYNYTILPDFSLGSHQSGDVTVDGDSVTVQVYAFLMAVGCSSTTSEPAG